jgi:hypothetical protein
VLALTVFLGQAPVASRSMAVADNNEAVKPTLTQLISMELPFTSHSHMPAAQGVWKALR